MAGARPGTARRQAALLRRAVRFLMALSRPRPHGSDRDGIVLGPASPSARARYEQALGEPKLWRPKRVLATPAALAFAHGRAILERSAAFGAEVVELKANRLTGLGGDDPRRAYIEAKSTLAVVVAPPSKRRLQPIPPSADWRFDLAEGCPAHCQYCYLAGSLSGPPITRVYANVSEILEGLADYAGRGIVTSALCARAVSQHYGSRAEPRCRVWAC